MSFWVSHQKHPKSNEYHSIKTTDNLTYDLPELLRATFYKYTNIHDALVNSSKSVQNKYYKYLHQHYEILNLLDLDSDTDLLYIKGLSRKLESNLFDGLGNIDLSFVKLINKEIYSIN